MKKIVIPFALAAILALSTGCSSSGETAASYDGFYAETTAAAWANGEYLKESADIYYDDSYSTGSMKAAGGEALPSSEMSETAATSEKKIIRNADLNLVTTDLDDTYSKLVAKLTEMGGSVFSVYKEHNDFSAYADAVFTLPPENLDAYLAYAGEVAEVASQSIHSEDITSSYVDTEVRLENKRRNLEKYYEYLEDADTLDEMIMIQNQIDMITADIESFETMLKRWNANLSESRINLNLSQPQDPNAIEIEDVKFSTLSFENMGKLMNNGIKKCVDVIGTLVQWFIIVVFTLLPVIAVAGVVLVIAMFRRRALDKKYPERVTARQAEKDRKRSLKLYYKAHGHYPRESQSPNSSMPKSDTNKGDTAYRKPPEVTKNTDDFDKTV